jgi:hypothetical protein
MKLTTKNYHSEKNKCLTSSKIKDYLLDERYFFDKHVLRIVEPEKTDAMLIGSMVDEALSFGVKSMKRKYVPVARRGKESVGRKTEVTQAMFDSAMNMIQSVMTTSAYKELDAFERQVILTADIPKSKYFDSKLAGMLDFLKVEENRAVIVDLKTSSTVDPKKYYYHSKDFGYWMQAATYSFLVCATYNIPLENIEFYHLVVEKDMKGIHKVRTFKFDPKGIAWMVGELHKIIGEITTKEEFKKSDCSFKVPCELQFDTISAEPITDDEWGSL